MDLSKQPLFQAMKERMDYLGQRQKVLAQNIANADTPKYQARDIRPANFKDALRQTGGVLAPTQTNPHHLPPVTPASTFAVDKDKRPYETSISKNGVVLEEQMVKISKTQGDFSTTAMLYKKYLEMVKMSLSRGGQ
jgi:flagellar basal-body rod protein FlgB